MHCEWNRTGSRYSERWEHQVERTRRANPVRREYGALVESASPREPSPVRPRHVTASRRRDLLFKGIGEYPDGTPRTRSALRTSNSRAPQTAVDARDRTSRRMLSVSKARTATQRLRHPVSDSAPETPLLGSGRLTPRGSGGRAARSSSRTWRRRRRRAGLQAADGRVREGRSRRRTIRQPAPR